MSNRPSPDPVEATFRDLRGAVYTGDGRAAMAAIERMLDLDRNEELAMELEAMLGLAQAPALRDLPVDLDELSLAMEGDPLLTGGRLDLRTGDVQQIGPLYESDCFDGSDESNDGEGDSADEADPGQSDGRGAFRRFRHELAEVPGELARFHRSTDDRRRGRARQWLAGSGLRPTVSGDPASPGGPDLHGLP